jgi:sulfatase maturation enzyme AslB (radical SAM superfamily)
MQFKVYNVQIRKETYTMDDRFSCYARIFLFWKNIMWQGGEVLVYKWFYEIIEMAAKYNAPDFLTNGLLLDKKLWTLLLIMI